MDDDDLGSWTEDERQIVTANFEFCLDPIN